MSKISQAALAVTVFGLLVTGLSRCAVYEPEDYPPYSTYGYYPYPYYGPNYAFAPPTYGALGFSFERRVSHEEGHEHHEGFHGGHEGHGAHEGHGGHEGFHGGHGGHEGGFGGHGGWH